MQPHMTKQIKIASNGSKRIEAERIPTRVPKRIRVRDSRFNHEEERFYSAFFLPPERSTQKALFSRASM